jgi:hypothetical protein
MRRDEFELLVISLLLANLAAIYLVGAALWRELQRPARIIRIYEGGRSMEASSGDEREPAA